MNFKEQFHLTFVGAPSSIFLLKRKLWGIAGLYLLLSSVIIGLVCLFLVSNEGRVHQAIADYLFPESWHFAAKQLIDRFLASQSRLVLTNIAITSSFLLIAMCLFRVKERLSFRFEDDAELIPEPAKELPLLVEFWEEVKLVVFYLTTAMSLFWLAHSPEVWRQNLALVLSYLFLFMTVALDFISPTLFRHKMKYSLVMKVLLKHPVAMLGFGCIFALPPLITVHSLKALGVDHWGMILFCTSAAQILSIVWACVSGTYLASRLFETARQTRAPMVMTQVGFWVILIGLFSANLYAFGGLARTMHHKSPLFKCEYSIVEDSFEIETPSVVGAISDLVQGRFMKAIPKVIGAVQEGLEGKVDVGVGFDLEIKNDNRVRLELEENRLEIRYKSKLIAMTQIQPFRVDPGSTSVEEIRFNFEIDKELVKQLPSLWSDGVGELEITLFVRIAKGIEFPIYLRKGSAPAPE